MFSSARPRENSLEGQGFVSLEQLHQAKEKFYKSEITHAELGKMAADYASRFGDKIDKKEIVALAPFISAYSSDFWKEFITSLPEENAIKAILNEEYNLREDLYSIYYDLACALGDERTDQVALFLLSCMYYEKLSVYNYFMEMQTETAQAEDDAAPLRALAIKARYKPEDREKLEKCNLDALTRYESYWGQREAISRNVTTVCYQALDINLPLGDSVKDFASSSQKMMVPGPELTVSSSQFKVFLKYLAYHFDDYADYVRKEQRSISMSELYVAAEQGRLEDLPNLLEQNHRVKELRGIMELYEAIKNNDLNVIQNLLAAGVPADKKNADGLACFAVEKGYKEVLEILLKEGTSIDSIDTCNRTLLHLAAQKGNIEIIKLLLAKGADAGKIDNDGKTPLDLAVEGGHIGITKALFTARFNALVEQVESQEFKEKLVILKDNLIEKLRLGEVASCSALQKLISDLEEYNSNHLHDFQDYYRSVKQGNKHDLKEELQHVTALRKSFPQNTADSASFYSQNLVIHSMAANIKEIAERRIANERGVPGDAIDNLHNRLVTELEKAEKTLERKNRFHIEVVYQNYRQEVLNSLSESASSMSKKELEVREKITAILASSSNHIKTKFKDIIATIEESRPSTAYHVLSSAVSTIFSNRIAGSICSFFGITKHLEVSERYNTLKAEALIICAFDGFLKGEMNPQQLYHFLLQTIKLAPHNETIRALAQDVLSLYATGKMLREKDGNSFTEVLDRNVQALKTLLAESKIKKSTHKQVEELADKAEKVSQKIKELKAQSVMTDGEYKHMATLMYHYHVNLKPALEKQLKNLPEVSPATA